MRVKENYGGTYSIRCMACCFNGIHSVICIITEWHFHEISLQIIEIKQTLFQCSRVSLQSFEQHFLRFNPDSVVEPYFDKITSLVDPCNPVQFLLCSKGISLYRYLFPISNNLIHQFRAIKNKLA